MSKKEETSNVFNVLAFIFDRQKSAKEAVKEIRSSGALDDQYGIA